MKKEYPFVAFCYNDEMWEFIERQWKKPMYYGFNTWDIVASELYDFSYC